MYTASVIHFNLQKQLSRLLILKQITTTFTESLLHQSKFKFYLFHVSHRNYSELRIFCKAFLAEDFVPKSS